MSDGTVPTSIYCGLLKQRGRDLDRIKALESMLLDAWLICQAGPVSDDTHRVRVLSSRVATWKAVLDNGAQAEPSEAA